MNGAGRWDWTGYSWLRTDPCTAITRSNSEQRLSVLAGASLAVVFVTEPESAGGRGMVDPEGPADPDLTIFRREGVAGIEIARCAEQWQADLVVLGRNGHLSPGLGTTTETVLRRRHGPTLLVPRNVGGLNRILYAIDGTERGLRILLRDGQFSEVTGPLPTALCVLPPDAMEQIRTAAGVTRAWFEYWQPWRGARISVGRVSRHALRRARQRGVAPRGRLRR